MFNIVVGRCQNVILTDIAAVKTQVPIVNKSCTCQILNFVIDAQNYCCSLNRMVGKFN